MLIDCTYKLLFIFEKAKDGHLIYSRRFGDEARGVATIPLSAARSKNARRIRLAVSEDVSINAPWRTWLYPLTYGFSIPSYVPSSL
jgi:hypothetical protein